jgi:adenylate cyclase
MSIRYFVGGRFGPKSLSRTWHGGRIAEIAGDAVLMEFPSAVKAVRWAADVQQAQERTRASSDPLALHLRIAINVYDVIDEDGILQD